MIEYFSSTRSMIILLPCRNVTQQNDKQKHVLQRRTLTINKNRKRTITRTLQLHKAYKLWKMSPLQDPFLMLINHLLIRTDFMKS